VQNAGIRGTYVFEALADARFGRFRRLVLPAEPLRQLNVDCGGLIYRSTDAEMARVYGRPGALL
jgi:hypothetical protein